MRFNPLSEKELQQQRGVLKPGRAEFEVLSAEEKRSKSSGAPMIELNIKVWDQDGKSAQIFDYLVSTAQWKLRNFAESIGKLDLYESGDIQADMLVGHCGACSLKTEKSEQYGDQTKIRDYLPQHNKEEKKSATVNHADDLPNFDEDDSIPF